jgi:hypothetical protein
VNGNKDTLLLITAVFKFKACKSVHHHTVPINQPVGCNSFPSLLLDVYVRLNQSDHDQQHCYHHASTVKPEAGTAVVELLMMGLRTPETC